ncbi:MAG TPA: glycoside hydrolase family 95 protein, partial [Phycisphaerae bacterium]|nr:glycoside hydrolase family 95 protein [Phycisphaerae bacterium]
MSFASYRLWETAPAERFADAHLLGNGRLGAAVFGTAPDEQIAINEDTLWSGSESRHVNQQARALLPEASRLIFDRKFGEANRLINERMLGIWMQSYQPLGTLHVSTYEGGHSGSEHLRRARGITRDEYRRTLDLDSAVETIEYREDGRRFLREYFVSAAAQVLAVRLSVDSGVMNCYLTIDSLLRHTVSVADDTLLLTGRAPDHVEPSFSSVQPSVVYLPDELSRSIRFAAAVRVVETDGAVTAAADRVAVDGASFIVFLLAAHTNYSGYLGPRNPDVAAVAAECRKTIAAAGASSWEKLRERHIEDHRRLFRRVGIEIGPVVTDGLPTSERMALQAGTAEDPSFAALALQYTRYLIIAASRPGTQAANLQGIWNPLARPPWSSNYTTNINLQMNYWGAEVLNLSECHGPMLDLVAESAKSGRETAADWYGLEGWVAHHNIDLWRSTWPTAGFACWAWWPMAAGWFCRHLWQHFQFGGDLDYLANFAYPLMEDAARFLLSSLV